MVTVQNRSALVSPFSPNVVVLALSFDRIGYRADPANRWQPF